MTPQLEVFTEALRVLNDMGIAPTQQQWDDALERDAAAEAVFKANQKHVVKRGDWYGVEL